MTRHYNKYRNGPNKVRCFFPSFLTVEVLKSASTGNFSGLSQFCLFPTWSISKGPIMKSCLIKPLLAPQFIYNFPFQGILIYQTQPPKFPNRCLKFINKEPMSLLERRAAFMRLGSRVWEMRALTQAPNLKIPSSGQSTQLSGCLEFGS